MAKHYTCDYCGIETSIEELCELSLTRYVETNNKQKNAMRALDLCPTCMVLIRQKLQERTI